MRILWHSNAPWAKTGYGTQTALFAPKIAELYDLALSANYGLNGGNIEWQGLKVYGGSVDSYGNDVLPAHASDWFGGDLNAGWVLILYDAWCFQTPALGELNVAVWCPVDHIPAPPMVSSFFRRFGALPIAMSKFGRDQFDRLGIDSLYVPHGIDTDIFRPLDKAGSRRLLGIPEDAFVVGMNAQNKGRTPNRKAFPEVFMAFSEFAKTHSDAVLYLHTESQGHYQGLDLEQLSDTFGISDRVLFVDQYEYRQGLPAEMIAATYSALDILANPSHGEGFGIPIVEAQSCGVPVLVSDHSSMPELVGAGWIAGGEPLWDDPLQSFYIQPSAKAIYECLLDGYASQGTHGLKARTFALQYDANYVWDTFWLPALADLEERWNPAAHPRLVAA